MISFVMPAHNEELLLGPTLWAVDVAAREVGDPFEVIVVDDASTDRTAAVAEARGGPGPPRRSSPDRGDPQRGGTRGPGRRLLLRRRRYTGQRHAVRAALRALRGGAVGGGCVFRFDGVLPLWARAVYPALVVVERALKLVGGCFLFCTREAFESIGGFSERYYAAEEAAFIRSLKQGGRFVVPRPTVITSGRKLRIYPARRIVAEVWALGEARPRGVSAA